VKSQRPLIGRRRRLRRLLRKCLEEERDNAKEAEDKMLEAWSESNELISVKYKQLACNECERD
jgi:hypothetical protein